METQIVVSAAAIVALIEGIKKAVPKLPSRYIPLLSVGIGLVLGLLGSITTKDWSYVVAGLVAGATASGGYDVVKRTITK